MAKVDGISLGLVAAGSLFAYAGLTGKSIPKALQAVVQGQSPATAPQSNPITGAAGGTVVPDNPAGASSATGSQIATDALAYQGHCYYFGGAPGTDGKSCWDCSSFVNWVIGHDLRLAIPGYAAGAYDGSAHGPNSFEWAAWTGCTTIGSDPAAAESGDLCIWMNAVGHIGIATGNGQMVSALDPTDGTLVTPITGAASGVFLVRRLKATLTTGGSGTKR